MRERNHAPGFGPAAARRMMEVKVGSIRSSARAALLAGLIAQPAGAAPSGESALEARAQAALDDLSRGRPGVRAVWRGATPMLITGLETPTEGTDAATRALAFVQGRADLLGGAELVLEDVEQRSDRAVVRLAQVHAGLRVADHSVVVTMDERGRVVRVLNDAAALVEVRPAQIDAEAARRLAAARVLGRPEVGTQLPALGTVGEAKKVVFAQGNRGVEGYVVLIVRSPVEVLEVRIDGAEGEVFGVKNTVLR